MRKGSGTDSARSARTLRITVVVGAITTCVIVFGQTPAELRLGLRLDTVSSMQWNGGTIYAEGPSRHVLETSVKRIDAVWPGSTIGSFVIASDQGIGILLGTDVVSAGPVLDPGALIRSSRIDTLWVSIPGKTSEGSPHTRFIEWRGPSRSRELARISGSIVDFDVDAAGRLLYLTTSGRIFLRSNADQSPAEIVLPRGFSRSPERVFIDAQGSQITVYGGGALLRFVAQNRQWTDLPFDVRRQALVRHARSRRILVEDKFER